MDKELKKLNRSELIEILIRQSKEIDYLRDELTHANEELNNHKILIDEAGSIAEAALKINDIFAVAQKAADDYLNSVKILSEKGTGTNNKSK